jgi:hypothetical protein
MGIDTTTAKDHQQAGEKYLQSLGFFWEGAVEAVVAVVAAAPQLALFIIHNCTVPAQCRGAASLLFTQSWTQLVVEKQGPQIRLVSHYNGPGLDLPEFMEKILEIYHMERVVDNP